jgi:YVTN family beta-propeller protein
MEVVRAEEPIMGRCAARLTVLLSALAMMASQDALATRVVADTTPSFLGQARFGSALVGSAPAGHGPSAVAFDPATDTIYVANGNNANGGSPGGNTVSVIDGRHCNAHGVSRCKGPWPTVTVGPNPTSLAVDTAHHTVYVTNSDDTVSVVDATHCNGQVVSGCGSVPRAVPVGSTPFGVVADRAHHTVYVGNFDDNTVSLIDSDTCNGRHPSHCPSTPPPTVAVADSPGDVDINVATHTAYVTTLTGLTAFDTNTCNAVVRTGCTDTGVFTLCTDCWGPFSAAVDPATNTIYEGDGDTSVAAIDANACSAGNLAGCATAPFATLTLPSPGFEHVLGVVVDEPLHSVYALFQKDDLAVVIDTRTCNGTHLSGCGAAPRTIHTGADPESIALDPQTHTLYVANQVDDTVSVIDEARCNAQIAVGCRKHATSAPVFGAGGIAVDQAVETAYVTSRSNTVAMIDTRRCSALRPDGCSAAAPTVTVGDGPEAIAVDEAMHTAYVANRGTDSHGSISVLDTRQCNARTPACSATATVHVPAGTPTAIAVNVQTHSIYLATATRTGSDLLLVFDGANCDAVTTTGCDQSPAAMTVGPANGCSYVAVAVNEVTNTIYATDTNTCTVPFLGDKVYVYDGAHCDAADVTACGSPVGTVTAGNNPYALALDQTSNMIYAPLLADGEHPGNVAIIDGSRCNGSNITGCGQAPPTVPAEFGSSAAAVDPTTHDVYVANIEDTSVSVLETRRCDRVPAKPCGHASTPLPVDDYPVALAVDPTAGTLYVTSPATGAVTVTRLNGRR